ncbi:MAG: 30S ribosomal protein S16 [Pseudomonadales bacterium]|nr:30S ribosomal protein S16 [Pseudomonadales bacterium]
MVTIRLARHGAKKTPFYHITVADRTSCRDGRHVERLGFYNPIAKGKSEGLRVDLERLDYWLSVGARPSDSVKKLLKQARRNAAAPAAA